MRIDSLKLLLYVFNWSTLFPLSFLMCPSWFSCYFKIDLISPSIVAVSVNLWPQLSWAHKPPDPELLLKHRYSCFWNGGKHTLKRNAFQKHRTIQIDICQLFSTPRPSFTLFFFLTDLIIKFQSISWMCSRVTECNIGVRWLKKINK